MANARLVIQDLRTSQIGPYSLTIKAGECVSLRGPSGSGKSLLLRAIADLDPHEGQVLLENVPYQHIPAPLWRKKVCLVPVESQWWYDTVGPHFPGDNCPYLEKLGFDNDVLGWQIKLVRDTVCPPKRNGRKQPEAQKELFILGVLSLQTC